jgi:hypothetical protein
MQHSQPLFLMAADDRMKISLWLASAIQALAKVPHCRAVTYAQIELRNWRAMFSGANQGAKDDPEQARLGLSNLVDRLFDTAATGSEHVRLALNEHVGEAINAINSAIGVLRIYFE